VNRAIFEFNEVADKIVLRPAAQVYVNVVPDPIRMAVHSFLQNLLGPFHIAHNLLQGDFERAQLATGRFLTNTILGAGGLADVASEAGIPEQQEDFGQTLAVWGVGDGPYLVLPILGPSNLRDTFGYALDTVADPVAQWAYATDHEEWLLIRSGVYTLDRRASLLREIDDLRRNSIDFYATMRSLYQQQRRAAILNGRAPASDTAPEFPEFPEFPE
jgi:phospholipid-binding lipoprotein MlaA